MANKKYININPNVLLEWEYNSTVVSENYFIWSDLSKGTRNFLSTTNINDINHNLFPIDDVQKKYSKIDVDKFNFLKTQEYFTGLVSYDKITLYLPTGYNFDVYYGIYLKILSLDYLNKTKYPISNFYFDKSQTQTIGGTIEYSDGLINLATPFTYNQKEWGKYITYYIPSIYNISNQRLIDPNQNIILSDSINENLTLGVGLSTTSPIFLEFSFITSKKIVFDIPYYYLGDTYKTTILSKPEYETVGTMIEESTQGDFFEIYGTYNNSNEEFDNFVSNMTSNGRKINVEYTVTLYEENLQSGFPLTFLVDENFSRKIEYRPIIKYSNTTAAIDIEMKIIDLVDSSSFSRFASIGLTKNLLKYGKRLSKIEISNLSKPKIYNYKYDKTLELQTTSSHTDVNIVKVPFPILISNYKILANNFNSASAGDFKSIGLMNMILSPFDNVIKIQIGKQDSATSPVLPYNLSDILLNSTLNLIFRSDTKSIEKEIYYQTNENNFSMGVVVFKINQEDIPLLKQINKEKSDNFYLVLNSNKSKTLLYSGKFKIFENLKFLDVPATTTIQSSGTTTADTPIVSITTNTNSIVASNVGLNAIVPLQFDSNGIPILTVDAKSELDYYKNVIVWIKAGLTYDQINVVKTNIQNLGVYISYSYQTPVDTGSTVLILERVAISIVNKIKDIDNIDNMKELSLDFGWKKTSA